MGDCVDEEAELSVIEGGGVMERGMSRLLVWIFEATGQDEGKST